ncbi:radical SAM protein [Methanotrichaceae archaeon M04Ac]|uniref:Radical SAM protein n=1 Tax=Candidatus Methanocrinis alkalitolerans TaxID=3033395 RepID=A0ABT5XFI2_9EURY|nr:radical SAM protein [Candidatus Methanocrinis alkalitolerans]MCR3883081.1 radical SAM protein [Methanothrix sp.]MDF0593463.1 radical SAM protein [Candidatus Methanocrinis alkalitolerans]
MQVAERPLLKIEAETEGGKIVFRAKGPLSRVAGPVMKKINETFSGEKPISSEPDRIIFSTWIPPAPGPAFDRMISSQVAAMTWRRVPDQVSIAVIRACPNDCIHCSAPSRTGEVLSSGDIERVIGEGLDLGSYMITFDGGEPMTRRDLPDLVAKVDDRAISASFTSGFGLTEKLAKELKAAGLYAVRVSIDSPHPAEHDRFRGRKGAFSDALSGIKNGLAGGLLVDLFMVTSPMNIDDLEDAYNMAAELSVHELSLYEIVAVGRWSDHADEVLSRGDIDRLSRFQLEKNRLPEGPKVTALPHLLSPEIFGCFAGRRWLHVDASGDVLPCAYMPIPFGNVREMSLADIWREMGRDRWFRGKPQGCMMKDEEFRRAHPSIFKTG